MRILLLDRGAHVTMPIFRFEAREEDGCDCKGTVEADSRREANVYLTRLGLYPTSIEPHEPPSWISRLVRWPARWKTDASDLVLTASATTKSIERQAPPARKSSSRRSARAKPVDPECGFMFNGFLSHSVFQPHVSVMTPLIALKHRGETFPGPPHEAPQLYERMVNGGWFVTPIGQPESFADVLGLELDLGLGSVLDDGMTCSDIGPVKFDDYMPFLMAFRKIVEANASVEKRLAGLEKLGRLNPLHRGFWSMLTKNTPGFPECVFYEDFQRIDGIGQKTAAGIFRAGFQTLEDLSAASDKEILRVCGVGKKTLAAIREFVPHAGDANGDAKLLA